MFCIIHRGNVSFLVSIAILAPCGDAQLPCRYVFIVKMSSIKTAKIEHIISVPLLICALHAYADRSKEPDVAEVT